ncbi:MAG: hypothetical protein LKF36_14565 [Lactobacillus sp.]|jgi:Rgg/GadR/MutR family transcriptional activator|nr:hypothetical protein [Lactobacillus sp.]
MEKMGEVLHRIRISKGLKIAEVYQGILGKSTAYSLERGDIDTTADKFLQILKHLNVDLNEYEFIADSRQETHYINQLKKLQLAYYHQDLPGLKQLGTENLELYQHHQGIRYLHLHAVCQLYANYISAGTFDPDAKALIRQYLYNVENWTYYEWSLFGNVIFIFDIATVQPLIKKSIDNLMLFQIKGEFGNESIRFLSNVINICLEQRHWDLAVKYIVQLEKIEIAETAFLENIFKHFYISVLSYLRHTNPDLTCAYDIVDLFKKFDAPSIARTFEYVLTLLKQNLPYT